MTYNPYAAAERLNQEAPGPNFGTERVNDGDELMNVKQAAAFLTISGPTMRRLQQERFVPFIKVGGSVRFLKRDLRAFINKERTDAIEQRRF